MVVGGGLLSPMSIKTTPAPQSFRRWEGQIFKDTLWVPNKVSIELAAGEHVWWAARTVFDRTWTSCSRAHVGVYQYSGLETGQGWTLEPGNREGDSVGDIRRYQYSNKVHPESVLKIPRSGSSVHPCIVSRTEY